MLSFCAWSLPHGRTARVRFTWVRFALTLAAVFAMICAAPSADAASKRAKSKSTTKSKSSSKASSKATSKTKSADDEPAASGKIAVLPFEGEDPYFVRKHVIQALTDRGMRVDSSLRSADTAEQYRDMGAALDLAVYLHGHIKDTTADHAAATITIRSGVTGRKITTVTFNGYRRGLPFDVEEQLWDRVGTAIKRACAEASKAVRHHNEPMRIEAGTPL
jgi:hypothetical protein